MAFVIVLGMQKFGSDTRSELPRVLVLRGPAASVRSKRDAGGQQEGSWRNSVWHSVQISLTVDVKERSKNEYHFCF